MRLFNPPDIHEHYQKSSYLILPSNSNWRQFRVKRLDGTFVKIKKQIANVQELKKELAKFKGDISDIYYTTSMWLNPERIGPKKRIKGFQPIYIGGDILFDFDSDGTIEGLEEARLEAVKMLPKIEKWGLEIEYCCFSNKKGFHIVCKDKNKLHEDFRKRIALVEEQRKIYKEESLEIEVDREFISDYNRVSKILGSLNPQNGAVCSKITPKQLLLPINELLTYCHCDSTGRPLRDFLQHRENSNDVILACTRNEVDDPKRSKDPTSTIYLQTAMSNKILSTKDRYILILRYQGMPYKKVKRELKWLMHTYELTNWYTFQTTKNIYAINLKSLALRRLNKILNRSRANNATEQNKYKRLRMRISPKYDYKTMSIIENGPSFIETIASPYIQPISAAHYRFLNKHANIIETQPLVGNKNEMPITKTKTTTRW